MAWSRKKVNSETLNNGNEYTKNNQFPIEALNGIVNSGLYSQDFVEHLADTPDVSEAGNVGTPTVTLVDNPNATTDKPYKRFKFANLKGAKGDKGDKGDRGDSGEIYQSTGTSTTGAMSQNATTEELKNKLSLSGGTISGPLYIGKFEIYRMNGGDGFYIGVGDGGSDILSYQKGSMLVFNDATTKLILRGKEERPQYIDGNSKLNTLALTSDTTDKIKVINNIYKTTGIIFSGQSWQTNSQLNTAFTTGGGDLLIIISGRMTCDTFVSKLNFTIDSSASSSIDDSKSVYFDYNSPLDLAIFTVNNISAGTHTFRLWAQKYGGDGTTILPAYNTTQITIIEL